MERVSGAAIRFEIVVEEGVPHGDLFELEQTTFYRVVDRQSNRVIVSFEGMMEASLSPETGLWADSRLSGVCEVSVVPGERAVYVRYYDGREESVPLLE